MLADKRGRAVLRLAVGKDEGRARGGEGVLTVLKSMHKKPIPVLCDVWRGINHLLLRTE